ncbi:Phosphoglycerate mutase family protein [Perilla frutescens var. frutescens]|nr:Phosphoglycerate mutase family protein [Perilla frutescens var. frutescens]
MSAQSLNCVMPPRHFSESPLIASRHPSWLKLTRLNNFQAFSTILFDRNLMASEGSSASVLAEFDCSENGGTIETVSPKFTEIIVIRHGETEWNTNRRIQGHLDVDLNDVGRKQAVAVADRLSKENQISAVYASDLKRASCTAEVIAKACGVLEVTKDPDLRERHLGDLQGVVFHESHRVNPEAHKAFVSHHDDQEIPGGGESFNQLYKRCTSALQRIAKKHKGERVVVVSHGGTIRALHRKASPNQRCGKILNTSVNVFHLYVDGKWCVKSWGDVSHLNQTGFLDSGFGGDRNSG